jgi:hypothetical protein
MAAETAWGSDWIARGRHPLGRFSDLQRENAAKNRVKKTTLQSEKSHFSLGNAFFLQ